jgi:hypothetical protein
MGKTTEEILKGGAGGKIDQKMVEAIRADAIKRGLAKRVIHIEYDMLTGQLGGQASTMDLVTHLGILDFYRAMILRNFNAGKPPAGPLAGDAGAPLPEAKTESAADLCRHAYGKNGALNRPFYCNLPKGHDSHHREDPDLPSAVPEFPAAGGAPEQESEAPAPAAEPAPQA